jgi:signal transduction histidine kinase
MIRDALPRRLPGVVVARELGLAVLISIVTWGAWLGPYNGGWSGCECTLDSAANWATAAVAVVLALLRLRRPPIALVGAAALLAWYPGSAIVLAVTAFRAWARIPSKRRAMFVFALAAATVLGITLARDPYPWPIVLLGQVPALTIALGLPVGAQVLLKKATRLLAATRERAHYLEENYRLAHSAARLQERSRIAHEMHDQLGHRLTLISLHAGALELITAGEPGRGATEAQLLSSTAQTAMQELRTTLGVLGGSTTGEAPATSPKETGTHSDVAKLIDASRSAGMQVQLWWRGADLVDVPAAVRATVHRLVREGLTNVHRHAAGAPATVVVEHAQDWIRVDVSNPRSQAPEPTSTSVGTRLGLVGVQERVQLLGGHFSAGPMNDGGFRVFAELPLTEGLDAPAVDDVSLSRLNSTLVAGLRPTSRREARLAERERFTAGATGVALGAGLVGVQALVLVVYSVVPYPFPGESVYVTALNEIPVGAHRQELDNLVGDDPVLRAAGQAVESPPPDGADCLYAVEFPDEEKSNIVRFCMRDDRIVAIDRYPLPEVEQ